MRRLVPFYPDISTIGNGTVTGAIDALNTGIASPRPLSVTALTDLEYVSGVTVDAMYSCGMAHFQVYFEVTKAIPEWTSFKIAHINNVTCNPCYAVSAFIGDNASTILVYVDGIGDVFLYTHGSVSKLGWEYAPFTTRCITT